MKKTIPFDIQKYIASANAKAVNRAGKPVQIVAYVSAARTFPLVVFTEGDACAYTCQADGFVYQQGCPPTERDVFLQVEPTLKPWTWQEAMPLVGKALLKSKGAGDGYAALLIGVSPGGMESLGEPMIIECVSFEHAMENDLFSMDGGKTWLPCGVSEP